MTIQIVGLDIGYGYTKLHTCRTTIILPSIIGNAVQLKYRGSLLTNGNGISSIDDIRISTPDGTRFVGHLAASQSDVTWSLQNRNRTESTDLITLMLAAFSEAKISGPVNLVTGLPVRWYGDKEKLLKKLYGHHNLQRRGRGHKKTIVTIKEMSVLPQPFGSLYDDILTTTAKIRKGREGLLTQTVGVLDIGMHTTDYIICEAMAYREGKSSSIEAGMSTVYKLVARAVEDHLGLPLGLHQTDEAVRAGYVTVRGEKRALAPIIEPVLQMVAQKILSALTEIWGDGKNITTLFVSGGGASLIGPYLIDQFPQLAIVADGQIANVRGYYKYGLLKWKG